MTNSDARTNAPKTMRERPLAAIRPTMEQPSRKASIIIIDVSGDSLSSESSGVGSVAAGAAMAAPLFKKWLSASCSLPVTSVVSCAD